MSSRKSKKRKKIKFKRITFKLSTKQKKSLDNYCSARKTTPNKLIKKSIDRYINNFAKSIPEEFSISENQLDLFNKE